MTQRNDPPCTDLDAEAALLGALLSGALDDVDVFRRLSAEDFWLELHTRVFRTMRELHEARLPIGTMEVALKHAEHGGDARDVEMLEAAAIAPSVPMTELVGRVADLGRRRRASERLARAQLALHAGQVDEARDLVEKARGEWVGPNRLRRLGTMIDDAAARMVRRHMRSELPLATPWAEVNGQMGGGLWPGLHMLVSGTGAGKSTWSLQLALAAAEAGTPVAYVGLELDDLQLVLRLAAEKARVRWSDLYTGRSSDEAIGRAAEAMGSLEGLPLYLEPGDPLGWSPSRLREVAEAVRREHPEPSGPGSLPMLLVLDFLQLVGDEIDATGRRERLELRERIGRAAYVGRQIARELGVVVLMVSSTARERYGVVSGDVSKAGMGLDWTGPGGAARRFIQRADELVGLGKESGEIEYAADSVTVAIAMSGAPRTDAGALVVFASPKVRTGPPGWCALRFDGHRFSSCEDEGETAIAALKAKGDGDGAFASTAASRRRSVTAGKGGPTYGAKDAKDTTDVALTQPSLGTEMDGDGL